MEVKELLKHDTENSEKEKEKKDEFRYLSMNLL